MTLLEKKKKVIFYLLDVFYFCTGYLALNWINSFRLHYYSVSFSFENSIPFITSSIFGYFIVYISIAGLYVFMDDYKEFKRTAISGALLITLHLVIFYLLPVQMTMRPDISGGTGLSYLITKYIYIIDRPYNCFPSLHVAFTVIGIPLFWNYRRDIAVGYVIMSIIVSLSVVFIKQHYLLDVVGGWITPFLICAFVKTDSTGC